METDSRLEQEIQRRRTFAIISHPDAGKTTLTEKLLLYGGAIHLAGSVKARRAQRHATSDWMEMEQERGISITSSVLQFDYHGFRVNLLDTPGHQDFSEDTYRTLTAADCAVMLLDNRKGVEAQTRKLFSVCRRRRMPIFTFVNKCDRPGVHPLTLIDDVQADLGIDIAPVTWPLFEADRLVGVVERATRRVHLFRRGEDHGAGRAAAVVHDFDDPAVIAALGAGRHAELAEELALLDAATPPFDRDAFRRGELSPAFFGSALTNFGVEPFLEAFLELAPGPVGREAEGVAIEPAHPEFTGFVFKIQANMDPKHRDRIAFVRIVSGRFTAGMQVRNARSGRDVRLAAPQQFMAQERVHVDEAWAGDVVGIHDRGQLRIGDTLSANGPLVFADIPRFSPEHFARITVPDPLRRKHLDTGLRQLSEEGAAQVFYESGAGTGPSPIVGAVGRLQFDVLLHRLEHEYGVKARLSDLPYTAARWVQGDAATIRDLVAGYGRMLVHDSREQPLILFESEWSMRSAIEKAGERAAFFDVSP